MLKDLLMHRTKKELKTTIEDIHAHDLAQEFLTLDEQEKERFLLLIADQKLAEMVSYLETDDAALVLSEFDLIKQKTLVEMMEPDDAVDIILEMTSDEQESLLETLDDDSDVLQLIEYDEDETGSAMTNAIIKITPDMDVKKATKKVIAEAPEVESVQTIFVVDQDNKYVGIVKLKTLLKTKSPCLVSTLINEYPFAYDKDQLTKSIQAIKNYAIYEIPVLSQTHELLGMLTLDDALDIYQEEAQEDFEKLSALPETLDLPSFKTALHRLPWLITLLFMFIPLLLVTSLYEEILSTIAILMFFQPLILGMAGNVATQTLAVTLKMLSTEEKGMVKNSFREILTGMINGFVIGLIAFGVTFLIASLNTSFAASPLILASVVGLSLWLTVMIAPVTAILIPISLKLFKADPAAASGPFITTIIDVAALLIYFGLATLFLGGL